MDKIKLFKIHKKWLKILKFGISSKYINTCCKSKELERDKKETKR